MSADAKPFWVEILSRHGEVLARHRVSGTADAVHVGRGYDNDVVLDDPFVAARHIRIARDEQGALVAEDLDSANGLFLDRDRRRSARVVLDGVRPVRIGRTWLRVREADHAVEPERMARRRFPLWPAIALAALAVLGGEALTLWLRQTAEGDLGDYLGPLMGTAAVLAVWTTGWAVISRVFSGRARFGRHLLIATSGLFALMLLGELSGYGAFAFSRPGLVAYRYIVQWLLAGLVCFLHLRQVTQSREAGRSRAALQGLAVAALALLAIGMQALWQWESSEHTDRLSFLRGLKPPTFALAAPRSVDDFFAGVARLREPLERARSEPPGRAFDFASDDDEY